eukprot:scaffold1328_cov162-Amphora_coffeaeformis.AAC.22
MVALVLSKKSKPPKVSKSSKKELKEKSKESQVSKRVDEGLLKKAVDALLKHHQASAEEKNDGKEQLLGADTSIQVQFTLEVSPKDPTRKPLRIEIPHSIYNVSKDNDNDQLDEPEVCLIVKDESKPAVKDMIEQFPEHMGFIKKVLGLESLRKKHAQYSQRRELLKKYSVFMADDRILPMLTSSLGKDFFKAKKQPIPVDITRKSSLPLAIHKALSSTFLHLSEGNCVTVRAGYTHMSSDQLARNIVAVMENGVPMIPRKWANLRAIAIKTPTSTSLPFYNKTPAELVEIARLAGISQVWRDQKPPKADSNGADEDQDESPKKRKELKSPLVQALKKQKKADTTEKKEPKDSSKESSEPETKKTRPSIEKPAKKANDNEMESKAEKPASAMKQKRKSEEGETKKESPPKKSKSDAKAESSMAEKVMKGKTSSSFVASKQFTGSKDGYVFRKGPKGVGYYADVKPVVDKAALAALARMGQKGRRKSSGSSGKQGGGRKSRKSY